MYLEELISKTPMDNVEMIKKANFLSAQITEMYYVKKDTSRLNGITDGFEI